MLVDEAEIKVVAGKGGDGKVSFYRGKNGPSGGNGGKGGDVYAVLNTNISSLNKFIEKTVYKAENGISGGPNQMDGERGDDIELRMPPGTFITDKKTGKEIELSSIAPRILLARGGQGGKGNDAFKTPTYQTPRHAEKGEEGEERDFKLVMKLIADYGFIGLPNAGKSSLLNELTRAHVRTAPYPFTTLEPNLGAVQDKILADIPGLIEGASQGKGLGIKFLKHIEKVKLLLHCISLESDTPEKDYEVVQKELEAYKTELAQKPVTILLTKKDLVDEKTISEKKARMEKYKNPVLILSIYDFDSIEELKKLLIS